MNELTPSDLSGIIDKLFCESKFLFKINKNEYMFIFDDKNFFKLKIKEICKSSIIVETFFYLYVTNLKNEDLEIGSFCTYGEYDFTGLLMINETQSLNYYKKLLII